MQQASSTTSSGSAPAGSDSADTVMARVMDMIKRRCVLTLVKIFALLCLLSPLLAPARAEAQAIQPSGSNPVVEVVRAEAARHAPVSRPIGLDLKREGRVMDKSKSQVVTRGWADKMKKAIAEVEAETRSEVQVLVVDALGASPEGTRISPKQFATRIFNRWRIGPADKNNGVLVLHVLSDRRVEIEIGHGLNGYMPSHWCSKLLETEAVPLLKQGRYGEGLANVVDGLAKRLRDIDKELEDGVGIGQRGTASDKTELNQAVAFIIVCAIFKVGFFLPSDGGGDGNWSDGDWSDGGGDGGGSDGDWSDGGGDGRVSTSKRTQFFLPSDGGGDGGWSDGGGDGASY